MKKILTLVLCLFVVYASAQERVGSGSKPPVNVKSGTIVVTPLDGVDVTESDLVEALLGEGITFSNISFTGAQNQSGFFSNGLEAGIGIEEGIILSSGTIFNAIGPNEEGGISANLSAPGDADLTDLAGFPTYDANVLQFDFIPEGDEIFIQFVFGSDEYLEYVDSEFNDVFGFFLNDENIALVPGSTDPITINTVNDEDNSDYYVDNPNSDPVHNIEADGFTTVLVASGNVNPDEVNTIKLAIADGSDNVLDSWVFLKAAGFTIDDPQDPPQPAPVPLGNWAIILGMGLILLFTLMKFRKI